MLRNLAKKAALLALVIPLVLTASRAAVTVTGVNASGSGAPYDVVYVLNAPAATAQVEILNSSNQVIRTVALSGADLSRGTHHFLWDGRDTGGVSAPAGNYRARVTATGAAVPAGGGKTWGPVDPNTSSSTPVRYGLAVNRNVGSPYFGRIYVCDYSGDTLHAYTPDGTLVMSLKGTVDTGNPYNDFRNGIRDAFVGPDDRIYVAVQRDATEAGVLSMNQDGTDVVREFDMPDQSQSRSLFVTMSGDTKRFYFSYSTTNSQTAGPGAVAVAVKDSFGTTIQVFLSAAVDANAFNGLVDDIVVLDNFNDPTGHPDGATIYARHNLVGTAGESTIIRWDSDTADPFLAFWQRNPTFDPGTLAFGRGLSRDLDGNLWTTLSAAAVEDRGYVKLNQTTGAQIAKVDVPNGDGKPRFNDTDHKGNVIALTIGETVNSTYAKFLLQYAPQDSGSTDTTTSAPFAVSGVVLPPITITNLAVTDRTSTTATIEWDTDVAASSEVNFGPSEVSLPNLATGAPGTHHSVTLTGLARTSQVFFKVRSSADGFATQESGIQSLVTKDIVEISGVQVTGVSATSATVTWTTTQSENKPTDSVVRFGTSPDSLPQTATGNTDAVNHSVTLTGLTAGTTYYFVAQSGSDDVEATTSNQFALDTVGAGGLKVRTLSTPSDFKYGLLSDVLLTTGGLQLNTNGVPNGVDDASVPDLPEGAANHAVVAHGGFLYKIGGRHPSVNKDLVYVAPINEDGTVDAWRETSPLPDPRYFLAHAGFGYSGYVYVVGGGIPATQTTTLFARQNPVDGSLGPWSVAGTFPEGTDNERDDGAVAVHNGRVYYTAGESNTASVSTTWIADILADGTLSEWNLSFEVMPQNRAQHAADFRNGVLYVWGGAEAVAALQTPILTNLQTTPTATTPPDISGWLNSGPDLTVGRVGFAGDVLHGNALMIAGSDGAARTNRISYAPFNTDGSLGAFADAEVIYPAELRDMDGAAWQGRYYVVGGRSSDGAATFDANAQALATVVTFSDAGSFVSRGRYESAVIDLRAVEPLASLNIQSTGSVGLSVRVAGEDGVFGPWTGGVGAQFTFNNVNARYVQFALDLASDGAATPVVNSVALTYGTPGSVITLDDARRALSIAAGLTAAQPDDLAKLNVTGDSAITLADAIALAGSAQ